MKFLKQLAILLLLFTVSNTQAQSLDDYISNKSLAVVEVSGDQIFSLISNTDIAEMMPPSQTGEQMDVSQFGFDVDKKAYYFTQMVDSTLYHNFIVSLSDVQLASEVIGGMMPPPLKKVEGFDFTSAGGMAAAWSADKAIFSYMEVPKVEYTMDDLLEEKRKANEENTEDSEDENTEQYEDEGENDFQLEGDGNMEELETELMLKNLYAPNIYSEEELTDLFGANLTSILSTNSAMSVNKLSSYIGGKDKTSSAYFWINNIDNMLKENIGDDLVSDIPYLSSVPETVIGVNEVTGNLIFNKDEIKLTTEMKVADRLVSSYQKMYVSEMDKAFFKYFDVDDVLSYMSFSTDVAATLKEYPTMMETMYSSWAEGYSEEIDVATDLISVFLDEDAIAELITGDGLIILHDVEEKEVTYKTMEYDDDFNATEIEKTKMESLPMFSIMIGSKNEKIISKLMKISRKYKVAEFVDGHHKIMAKDMGAPFDVYFTHRDGIAFLTNSSSRLSNYKLGKKICNLGDHKKVLKDNMFNLYVNLDATINKASSFYPMDPKMTEYVGNNYKEMYMTASNMDGDKFGFDMIFKTSGAKGNALKLLLATVKDLSGGGQ